MLVSAKNIAGKILRGNKKISFRQSSQEVLQKERGEIARENPWVQAQQTEHA
jgi:hypothetical protein